MKKTLLFPILIIASLLFDSCEADINLSNISNEISLHPDLIVPIGGASFTLGDLISSYNTQGAIAYGANNEIDYINLDTIVFKFRNLDFVKNSVGVNKSLYFPLISNTSFPSGTQLPSLLTDGFLNLGLATNADRIDSIVINSATLSIQIDVSNDLKQLQPSDLTISLIFPDGKVKKINGSNMTTLFTPNSFGSTKDVVLTNFVMNTSGNQSGIPIQIKIDANTGSNSFSLNSGSNVSCSLTLKSLDYKIAYGFFAPSVRATSILKQNINLDKNLPKGLYLFDNPHIDITTVSNIGAFLNFKVYYLKAYQSYNQASSTIKASFDGKDSTSFQFNRKPKLPGDTVQLKLKTLDKTWGGVDKFFNTTLRPDILEYNFGASIDTVLTKTSNTPGFITPDGNITVYLKSTLPINFDKGSYFSYNDSIKNIFAPLASALDQYSVINETALVFNITNGLPVKTTLTLKIVDANGLEIPTNFEKTYIIPSGTVDASGIVQAGKEYKQVLTISVSKDQLASLRNASKILYNIRVEGSSIDSKIQFTKNNSFDIRAGVFVNGDVNVKLGVKKNNSGQK